MIANCGPPFRKRDGVSADTPDPYEPQHLAQITSGSAIVQACAHKNTVTVREPPGRTHYSREICIVCGRHLRWLPKPANVERQKLNAFRLARLAMCGRLTHWEKHFVAGISHRQKGSPKQQQIIDRLCREYLEGKAP
jgi:hypothetical protein